MITQRKAPLKRGFFNAIELLTKNLKYLEKGQPLAKVAEEEYVLAVTQAEAALELAGQEIGAGTAGVSAAQARLLEASTSYQAILTDANRLFAVEDQNVVPQQNIDRARSDVAKAKEVFGNLEIADETKFRYASANTVYLIIVENTDKKLEFMHYNKKDGSVLQINERGLFNGTCLDIQVGDTVHIVSSIETIQFMAEQADKHKI
mgnify:CR=1 FL=1